MSPSRPGTGRDRSGGRGRGAERDAGRGAGWDRAAATGRSAGRGSGRGSARAANRGGVTDGPDGTGPDGSASASGDGGSTDADRLDDGTDRADGDTDERHGSEERAPEAGATGNTDTGRTGDRSRSGSSARPATRASFHRRRVIAAVVATAVLLGALAAGGWWLLGRFGPDVQDVRVSGVRAIPDADVLAAADVSTGVPLAAVDIGGVAARVSGIPGVAEVDITRAWPHTLDIAVVERMPVAMADTPDGRQLVDGTGLAYRTPPDPAQCSPLPAGSAGCQPPRLPMLELPRVVPGDPATMAALAALAAMDPQVRDQVDAVSLGSGGTTLEFALTNGRRVLWGRWAGSDAGDTPRRAAILGPLLTREGTVYDVSSADLPTVRE